MDQSPVEPKLPLAPIKETNVDELVSAYVSNLGIPYLSLRYERVEQLADNGQVVIRQMLDFLSEGGRTPCDVVKDISSLDRKSRYRISSHLRQLPPKKESPLTLFKKEFPEYYSTMLSADGLWQESTAIIPHHSDLAFALDSFAKWPAWLLLNTTGPLSALRSSDVNDTLRRLEGEQLGLRREMVDALFPCKVIRFNQDLIKIVRDQLVMGPQESLIVDFELGPFGYQFTSANPPTLEYSLWGSDNKSLTTETIPLSTDAIKYGVRLPRDLNAVAGKEIAGSSLKLFLGKTLVDKMEGFYIRNIRINIERT